MKTVWHNSPPPSVGWWPASPSRSKGVLRWWNGKRWSDFAKCTCSAEEAAKYAADVSVSQCGIEWTERWWV